MKQRLNPVILIISLAIIGFFVGVYFPRVWDVFFSPAPFVFTVWESAISLVLLLLICLLCARIILWVYSRIQVPNYPMRSLVLSFLILMATPLLCIGIGFQQYQLLLSKLPDQHAGIPVSTGYINFFWARAGNRPSHICNNYYNSIMDYAWEKTKGVRKL